MPVEAAVAAEAAALAGIAQSVEWALGAAAGVWDLPPVLSAARGAAASEPEGAHCGRASPPGLPLRRPEPASVAVYLAIAPSPTRHCNRALGSPDSKADSLDRPGRGGGAAWPSAGSGRCSGLTSITISLITCSGRMLTMTSGLMPTTTSTTASTVPT